MRACPDRVIIADGTDWAIGVSDLRRDRSWATATGRRGLTHPGLVIHHVGRHGPGGWLYPQMAYMHTAADRSPYGLAYNFLIFPDGAIFYLNDVDLPWPHTRGHNHWCALGLAGHYSLASPTLKMADAAITLAGALASMWGITPWVVKGHRDLGATVCPGDGGMEVVDAIAGHYGWH